jgi:hypothetical protein
MPESEKPAKGEERGFSADVIKTAQVASAVAALIGAVVLVYNLAKPGPGPAVVRDSLSKLELKSGDSLYSYLNSQPGELERELASFRSTGFTTAEATEQLKLTKGVLAEFAINTEGPPSQTLDVSCTVYNAANGEFVPKGAGVTPKPTYVSHVGTHTATESCWVQYPAQRGNYEIEIGIKEPGGQNLSHVREKFHSPGKQGS